VIFFENIFAASLCSSAISIYAFCFLSALALNSAFFQIPAAASITVFFAILIGVAGAFTYFLQSWSVPYLLGLIIVVNLFYTWDWIDPRNKAFGLKYTDENQRPDYSRAHLLAMASAKNVSADSLNMILARTEEARRRKAIVHHR
jgi:hypothetical protein